MPLKINPALRHQPRPCSAHLTSAPGSKGRRAARAKLGNLHSHDPRQELQVLRASQAQGCPGWRFGASLRASVQGGEANGVEGACVRSEGEACREGMKPWQLGKGFSGTNSWHSHTGTLPSRPWAPGFPALWAELCISQPGSPPALHQHTAVALRPLARKLQHAAVKQPRGIVGSHVSANQYAEGGREGESRVSFLPYSKAVPARHGK